MYVTIPYTPSVSPISSHLSHLISLSPVFSLCLFVCHRYKQASPGVQAALHSELKELYCSTRRLDVDRMECGPRV